MSVRILLGDVREKLAELPDESVHCVVTSPPYFGLRDYGTASWEGGDPACGHVGQRSIGSSTLKNDGRPNPGVLDGHKVPGVPYRGDCPDCGATRTDKQIGLEPTPAEFVQVMVEVFREVRRVLRKDGTCWINLGDSYSTHAAGKVDSPFATSGLAGTKTNAVARKQSETRISSALPEKNLLGIPWRVAFALQADGWYLRQDIIWAKPNPMPESVTDRCTKAHEYLFLLSKSPRYHYDADAIAEATLRAGDIPGGGHHNAPDAVNDQHMRAGLSKQGPVSDTRNRRSVWTVATQPFKEAHFATFPPDLIEPCIRAGCPKDCCAKCGAPVVRVVERGPSHYEQLGKNVGSEFARGDIDPRNQASGGGQTRMANGTVPSLHAATSETTGWSPSCSCELRCTRMGCRSSGSAPLLVDGVCPNCDTRQQLTARGTVLDPFGGAGTTGLVADRLQRDAILIELNPAYAELARERIRADSSMFAEIA